MEGPLLLLLLFVLATIEKQTPLLVGTMPDLSTPFYVWYAHTHAHRILDTYILHCTPVERREWTR